MRNNSTCQPGNKPFTALLFRENPVFVMLLGLCPALAVSDTVLDGLGIGIATCIVLVISCLVTALVKNIIPKENRIIFFIIIVAVFTSLTDWLMDINLPQMRASLGIFVPLIAANCLIYRQAGLAAQESSVARSIKNALGVSAGFILALMLLSSVREIFGRGTFLGHTVISDGFKQQPVTLLILPAGALLTFAFLKLGFNSYRKKDRQ